MSKTIKKALNILQFIAEDPETPHSSGQIAKELKLNNSTCVFLLNTLVECGFVDQKAPRKGYTLGPMSYFLGRKGPYRKDLIHKAETELEDLSLKINETVLLAVLRGKQRIVLCQFEGNREVQISKNRLLLDDFYTTATGNLLLANMPEKNRISYISKHGYPRAKWTEAYNEKKMNTVLTEIRKKGMVIKDGDEVLQLAFAVKENDQVIAAIGIPVPKYRFQGKLKEKILREAMRTAKKISAKLSPEFLENLDA